MELTTAILIWRDVDICRTPRAQTAGADRTKRSPWCDPRRRSSCCHINRFLGEVEALGAAENAASGSVRGAVLRSP